ELAVGYYTLFGDGAGGLSLIGDLYKTEVFALSRHINQSAGRELIPEAIIRKPPSAELAPGQQDTDSLPPYEVLDELLKLELEDDALSAAEAAQALQVRAMLQDSEEGRNTIARIRKLIARSEYKRRQAPPILQVRA